MAILFGASEVLEFAMKIEENGEIFYRETAKKMETKEIKETFNYLADEEVRHKQRFKEMLSSVEKYAPPESYPGEYFAYLRAYADEHIFSKEKTAEIAAKEMKSAKEAVKFALSIENDSILYYLETRNLVPEPQRGAIDRIVEEERRHYLRLHNLKI